MKAQLAPIKTSGRVTWRCRHKLSAVCEEGLPVYYVTWCTLTLVAAVRCLSGSRIVVGTLKAQDGPAEASRWSSLSHSVVSGRQVAHTPLTSLQKCARVCESGQCVEKDSKTVAKHRHQAGRNGHVRAVCGVCVCGSSFSVCKNTCFQWVKEIRKFKKCSTNHVWCVCVQGFGGGKLNLAGVKIAQRLVVCLYGHIKMC